MKPGLHARALTLALSGFVFSCGVLPAQTTLFSENFSGTSAGAIPTGWYSDGSSTVLVSTAQGNGNANSLLIDGFDSGYDATTTAINTVGFTSTTHLVQLSFDLLITVGNGSAFGIGPTIDDNSPAAWIWGYNNPDSLGTSVAINYNTGTGGWQTFTYTVADTYLNITNTRFAFIPREAGTGVYLDNLKLTATAIPEPATSALAAGAAMLGLAWSRRRRLPV